MEKQFYMLDQLSRFNDVHVKKKEIAIKSSADCQCFSQRSDKDGRTHAADGPSQLRRRQQTAGQQRERDIHLSDFHLQHCVFNLAHSV